MTLLVNFFLVSTQRPPNVYKRRKTARVYRMDEQHPHLVTDAAVKYRVLGGGGGWSQRSPEIFKICKEKRKQRAPVKKPIAYVPISSGFRAYYDRTDVYC